MVSKAIQFESLLSMRAAQSFLKASIVIMPRNAVMSDTSNIPRDLPDFLTGEALHEAYEPEISSQRGDPIRLGESVAAKGDSITVLSYSVNIPITLDSGSQNYLGTGDLDSIGGHVDIEVHVGRNILCLK